MKRTLILAVLILALALSACGKQTAPAETPAAEPAASSEPAQAGEPAAIANPWRDVAEEEAKALCPASFVVPEGAENVRWSVLDPNADTSGAPGALVQLSFDQHGLNFTAREQVTGDAGADISGMYYEWTAQNEWPMKTWNDIPCRCFRFIGDDGYADLCTWYDEASGVSYSLSTTAKDLDGFDLQAIAEALSPRANDPALWYEGVIAAYRTAYAEGKRTDLEYVFGNGLSEYVYASSHVGYCFLDLDGDGTEELIIADPVTGPDLPIFAVYTLSSGVPVELCVSQARDRFYLRTDNSIINEGSGGASNSMVFRMVKDGDALVGVEGVITSPGSSTDEVLCYWQNGSVDYEPRPEDQLISLDDYQAKWMEWKSFVYIPELTAMS